MPDIQHAIQIASKPEAIYPLIAAGDQWNGTHIVFRLEGRASGTMLRFTHAGWPAETDYFTSCNTTWGELMFRLKSAAEGKPRGPLFLAADLAY